MSIESLKSILISGYKSAIFKKYFPGEVLNVEPWGEMLQDILDFSGKTQDDVFRAMQSYEYKEDLKDPMKDIIEHLITVFIADTGHTGHLWENIISIVELGNSGCTCCKQDGSRESEIKVTYELRLKSKDEVLSSCTPMWVWKNYDEVCGFMNSGNEFYKSLEAINGKSYDILYKYFED